MKKTKKLLVFVPLLGLFLSGCSFQEVKHSISESWIGQHILHPVYDPIRDLINGGKKEEKSKEGEGEKEQASLESISVSGTFKQEYSIGEELDTTGIVVTATYSDGSTKDVSAQASFSGFSSETKGTCTVTVTFEGKTAEFTCTISQTTWSTDETALLDQYLHGVSLPYFDSEGATLVYNQETKQLNIKDKEGKQLSVSGTEVPDYAAKFKASEGWEDVSYQYQAYSTAPTGSFWVFEKSVQTSEGFRRISVQFFGSNGTAYSLTGSFYFFAHDPFSYSFPAAELANEFQQCKLTPFTISAPTKEGLIYFEYTANSYNVQYVSYYKNGTYSYDEIHEYIFSNIYVYGLTSDEFGAYLSTLSTTGGWTVTEAPTTSDYSYLATKQIGEEGIAHVNFAVTSDYIVINIELLLEELPKAEWPTEDIQKLFTEGEHEYYAVPAFEGANVSFKVSEYLYWGIVPMAVEVTVVGATEAEISSYLETTLPTAGWTVTDKETYYTAGKIIDEVTGKQANLEMETSSNGDFVITMYYELTITKWPVADVAKVVEVLSPGSETVVPAINSGTSYSFYDSQELDVYGPDTLVAEYAAILVNDNNWTEDTGNAGTYISPNQDLSVTLEYDSYYKCLMIIFNSYLAPSAEWPTETIAALFPEGTTDVLPPFEGEADSYQVHSDAYGTGVLVIVGEENIEAAIASYKETLEEAHFVEDEDNAGHYISPNGQFIVEPYSGTDGALGIALSLPPTMVSYNPTKINAALKELGYDIVLPEFALEDVEWNYFDADEEDPIYEIACVMENSSAANDAIKAFEDAMVNAGYPVAGRNNYKEPYFYNEAGDCRVDVSWGYNSTYQVVFYIDIYPEEAPQPGEGMTPEAVMNEIAPWFGVDPKPDGEGGYICGHIYDNSDGDSSPEDLAGYAEYIMSDPDCVDTDLTTTIEWYESDGTFSALYSNDANTFVEFYIYSDTRYMKDDEICDPDTEGAVAFDATIVEVHAYSL